MAVSVWTTYRAMNRTMAQCQKGFNVHLEMLRLDKILIPLLMSASAQRQKNEEANFKGDQSSLVFTTLNHMRYPPEASPIATVTLKHSRDEGLTLTLNPYRFLTKEVDSSSDIVHRFPHMKELELEYHSEEDQLRSWDAEDKGGAPPRIVTIKAKFEEEGATKEIPYTRHVPVPTQRDLPLQGTR